MRGDVLRKWHCQQHDHEIKDLGRDGWNVRWYGCDCGHVRVRANEYKGQTVRQRWP